MTVPTRRKLPDERQSITHKFDIEGYEGWITIGLYEDGSPGEIFLTLSKVGSTLSGLVDAFAQALTLALQYGVPLEMLAKEFEGVNFKPSGETKTPDIRFTKSIVDYLVRYLKLRFLPVSTTTT